MQTQDTTAHTFTTIRTADLLDWLADAVDTARASTAPLTWQNAISAAWDYLLQVDEISYDISQWAIRVESATRPGRCYVANGECSCEAFTRGQGVCWHRAAARLVRRAMELRELAAELVADAADAGETWYDAEIAREGAKARIGHLAAVAVEWDAESERQRLALSARIGAAQARVMAQAA
jgi:hypothetical protein